MAKIQSRIFDGRFFCEPFDVAPEVVGELMNENYKAPSEWAEWAWYEIAAIAKAGQAVELRWERSGDRTATFYRLGESIIICVHHGDAGHVSTAGHYVHDSPEAWASRRASEEALRRLEKKTDWIEGGDDPFEILQSVPQDTLERFERWDQGYGWYNQPPRWVRFGRFLLRQKLVEVGEEEQRKYKYISSLPELLALRKAGYCVSLPPEWPGYADSVVADAARKLRNKEMGFGEFKKIVDANS